MCVSWFRDISMIGSYLRRVLYVRTTSTDNQWHAKLRSHQNIELVPTSTRMAENVKMGQICIHIIHECKYSMRGEKT
jgi:hypothetical protein